MNIELHPELPILGRAISAIDAMHRHSAEMREKARLQAQTIAALKLRSFMELALTRGALDGSSIILTKEADGRLNAIGEMTKETRGGFEAWIQYFTVSPNNTIMAGKTNPKAPRDLDIDMKPFQIGDVEAVDILIRRMAE
jgi:hypothetical protein